ncbi:MAG TPA: nucleotidyltransferase domain-containing protein [Spirochaetota bacterium]|nr:nucleotidyltransferase domain-containing protein [Spirochaetota bacterium]HOM08562.1 nucleotidyltransferase domain-containing protein [Spirochaetota bacterium]HPP48381.1 nucleotidyltransferase domain-containing protein [Spirochaetota bacterium]
MKQSPTYILDRIIHQKKEERERIRCELLEKVHTVIGELHSVIAFKEAYIFGSIIRPYSFTENSDIDIGFIGLDDKDLFKAMSFLSARLGYEVDVIQIERHRLGATILSEGLQWKKKE